ncbi:GerMN domain-containing protein [Clostridium sp. MSJ-11]|uniref:GerMN domain-containing protein n=1 Tax=Clostridium mobile TaxID=2841512 RepID=A0ABS6EBX9_9CLOT|nr:GerMN domain-containing protein [Clostridium mobile]MBU5482706.1 GerMN domain-containing protein [Clostridium mobile]
MKNKIKVSLILLSLLLSFNLVACGKNNKNNEKNNSKEVVEVSTDKKEDSKPEEKKEENKKETNKETNGEKEVVLYFSDENAEYLVGETRKINNPTPKAVVEQLIMGPKGSKIFGVFPENTKVIDIEVKDKIAKVNFTKNLSQELNGNYSSITSSQLMLYSLANTLITYKDFGIEKVEIAIEGKKINLFGPIDISSPVELNKDILK